jgi:hemoglobin
VRELSGATAAASTWHAHFGRRALAHARALAIALAKRCISCTTFRTTSPGATMMTIYDQLGGAPALDAAVDLFYRKVLGDDALARFFDSTDMAQQAAKQKAFLTFVLGGPATYSGEGLRVAHAKLLRLGLDDAHFDAVVAHLGATLRELGVAADVIAQVAATAESTRHDVLGR